MQKFPAQLVVEGIVHEMLIGCGEHDKVRKQPVEIDVGIFFTETPPACTNDELTDTACSSVCIEVVRKVALKKHFFLLEHLAYEIHTALTKALPAYPYIAVRVRKLKPPFQEVQKGICFTYSPTGQRL
jgi:FolB domain-containing protein